jgi:hypothetical protein
MNPTDPRDPKTSSVTLHRDPGEADMLEKI